MMFELMNLYLLMMSQKKKYLKSDFQVMIGLMRILLRDDEQTMPVKYYIEFNKFANRYIVYGMKQFRHDVS